MTEHAAEAIIDAEETRIAHQELGGNPHTGPSTPTGADAP